MWYVIQVFSGREQTVCDFVTQALEGVADEAGKPVLRECFVPRYQTERKFRGEYRPVLRSMFPGYVIAVTRRVGLLNRHLKRIPQFTKILGSEQSFVPLDRAEKALINAFTTEQHRVVRMSKAVSCGDHVVVTEGPLLGREGWIVQMNRRKGTARVETKMFGRTLNVEIGLAVVSNVAGGGLIS